MDNYFEHLDNFDRYMKYRIECLCQKLLNSTSKDVNSIYRLAKEYHNNNISECLLVTYNMLSFEDFISKEFPLRYILYFIENGEIKTWSGFKSEKDLREVPYYSKWLYYVEYTEYKGIILDKSVIEYNLDNRKYLKNVLYQEPFNL